MKAVFLIVLAFLSLPSFAQSANETEVLKKSAQIFRWEVENKIDLLSGMFSDKLEVVTSRGDIQSKEQYLASLKSGTFTHDSISVEQPLVTITGNTAILIGKGWFHMTVSGNKLHRHLSYMEVFIKENESWLLHALYASTMPDQQQISH